MIHIFELGSREENGAFIVDDELRRRLATVSGLRRCQDIFPIRAVVNPTRAVKKGRVATYSVDGLRRLLCLNEEQAALVKFFDKNAFFGEIHAAGLSSQHYLYIPSIIMGPSKEHSDTMLGVSGRYRLRTPDFECIPDGVGLFTVSEAYEAAGQTYCTQDFIDQADAMRVKGFALWDVRDRREFVI